MAKIKFYRNLILIILFMTILVCPVVLQISGYHFKEITTENRVKTKFPDLKISGFAKSNKAIGRFLIAFDKYFKDNFAFRDILIRLYRNIKLGLLITNPFPDRVVIGREGWMFLGDYSSSTIKETKGLSVFSDRALELITKNIAESIRLCDSAGIGLYLAIAPEKGTVYGNFLPIIQSRRPTKLQQVKKQLNKIGFPLMDLKDNFKQLQNPAIYYKTDSHWNEFGEFYGYQTLMLHIKKDFPSLDILQINDFTIDTIFNHQGDLAKLLFLPGTERKYVFTVDNTRDIIEIGKKYSVPESYPFKPSTYERRSGNTSQELKVLVFHDSFFREFPKFLAPSFKETVFIWSVWDKKIILNEKPDIVIFEITERNLDLLLYPLK